MPTPHNILLHPSRFMSWAWQSLLRGTTTLTQMMLRYTLGNYQVLKMLIYHHRLAIFVVYIHFMSVQALKHKQHLPLVQTLMDSILEHKQLQKHGDHGNIFRFHKGGYKSPLYNSLHCPVVPLLINRLYTLPVFVEKQSSTPKVLCV